MTTFSGEARPSPRGFLFRSSRSESSSHATSIMPLYFETPDALAELPHRLRRVTAATDAADCRHPRVVQPLTCFSVTSWRVGAYSVRCTEIERANSIAAGGDADVLNVPVVERPVDLELQCAVECVMPSIESDSPWA